MRSHTLLYAEDDALIRENLLYILRDFFDEILIVKNGQEALDVYREKQPDTILLDICMPEINGLDVAKMIREEDESVPIIMLTGHSDRERLLEAVNLKLEAYLVKPVDYTQLSKTLTRTLEKLSDNDMINLRDDLVWNRKDQLLTYRNKVIKLTKKEKLTVDILTRNINKYVSNDALIYHIWDNEIPDDSHDNKLIQLIYRLNKKFYEETDYNEKIVENSYTLGYRILYLDA
jgi:DNA-binding response OmpR family regulator